MVTEKNTKMKIFVVDILGVLDRGLMDELSKIIGEVATKRALEALCRKQSRCM